MQPLQSRQLPSMQPPLGSYQSWQDPQSTSLGAPRSSQVAQMPSTAVSSRAPSSWQPWQDAYPSHYSASSIASPSRPTHYPSSFDAAVGGSRPVQTGQSLAAAPPSPSHYTSFQYGSSMQASQRPGLRRDPYGTLEAQHGPGFQAAWRLAKDDIILAEGPGYQERLLGVYGPVYMQPKVTVRPLDAPPELLVKLRAKDDFPYHDPDMRRGCHFVGREMFGREYATDQVRDLMALTEAAGVNRDRTKVVTL